MRTLVKTDTEFVVDGATITRRAWTTPKGKFVRGALYVGGWCRATYKTEGGLDRAVQRLTK